MVHRYRLTMLQRQKDGAEIFSSTTAMRDRWIMVMLFMYMGDLLASTANDSRKARLLADGIRVIGHLLLGYQS